MTTTPWDKTPSNHFVAEVVELAAAVQGHKERGGAFLDGDFGQSDGVVDGIDGAAKVQLANHGESTLDVLAQQGAAQANQYGYA